MFRRLSRTVVVAVLVLLVLIQFVPYGRSHTNPPVRQEPAWDSVRTRQLAVRTCFDCHSNQTDWPWYANIAPASWLAQYDVDEGRAELNFSEWDRGAQREARDAARTVEQGEMPQWYYVLGHPDANLSASERQEFIRGLEATFGREPRR